MRNRVGVIQLFASIMACVNGSIAFDSSAQSYPVKPVHLIVGFPPGGGTDLTARMVAQNLAEIIGQPVIVENRPGAGGSIADERIARSAPDGYTLVMMSSASPAHPALMSKLSYNLDRDFAPVSLVVRGPYLLIVHASVPARNVRELIALARSKPGKMNYGSGGIGTPGHLTVALFNLMAKTQIIHVPYKGAAEFGTATASGQVDMSFPSISGALPFLQARKVKALAVSTAKRSSLMSSIPTIHESGLPGYEISGWYGVVAPAGVSKDVIGLLNAAISKVVNAPAMTEWLGKQGFEPQASSPEQFQALLHEQIERYTKLIRLSGAKAD